MYVVMTVFAAATPISAAAAAVYVPASVAVSSDAARNTRL